MSHTTSHEVSRSNECDNTTKRVAAPAMDRSDVLLHPCHLWDTTVERPWMSKGPKCATMWPSLSDWLVNFMKNFQLDQLASSQGDPPAAWSVEPQAFHEKSSFWSRTCYQCYLNFDHTAYNSIQHTFETPETPAVFEINPYDSYDRNIHAEPPAGISCQETPLHQLSLWRHKWRVPDPLEVELIKIVYFDILYVHVIHIYVYMLYIYIYITYMCNDMYCVCVYIIRLYD